MRWSHRLCLAGRRVAVVAGKAGTGKTFALGAAREAWEAAGYPVLGVAVARVPRASCEDGAGIESTSVAACWRGPALPRSVVLVVDEAGMVGTRQLQRCSTGSSRARGKLVLVGDHRQLPELEAGGVFRGLVHRGLGVELRENRRQIERWEREALDHLRDGRVEEALEVYARHGRVFAGADAGERLVDDWRRAGSRRLADDRSPARGRRGPERASPARAPRSRRARPDEIGSARRGLRRRRSRPRQAQRSRAGVSNGERGRVVADRVAGLALECGGRRVQLDRRFLLEPTARAIRRSCTATRSPATSRKA